MQATITRPKALQALEAPCTTRQDGCACSTCTKAYTKAMQAFLDYAQSLQDPSHPTPTSFEVESGRKYDRVVQVYGNHRSAFCFVQRADGAVLMAASWRAPAKHVRGSIYADSAAGYGIGKYGAKYLR